MSQDAFIGLLGLCGFAVPLFVWAILRWWRGLAGVQARTLLALFGLGALMCIVVLMRKHIEARIIMLAPQQYWAYTLAQIDNEWWEQVGKLVAMLIALRLISGPLRTLFTEKRSAVAIGYWAGLGYGFGEAFILAVLYILPAWGPFFGRQSFTPYMVGWAYVWDRLWAMNLHAVMGGLIGLGLYGYFALGSRKRLGVFFVLAMLYHHSVDGTIITAMFVPALARLMLSYAPFMVPLYLGLGLILLAVAYRLAQPGARSQAADIPTRRHNGGSKMKGLTVVFIVALLLVGCGATPTPMPAATIVSPWGAGEQAEYSLQGGGSEIGTMVFTVSNKDDGYMMSSEAIWGAARLTTQVSVDKSLNPIANTQELAGTGKTDYMLTKVYDNGKLSLQAKTADGDKATTANYPAGAWDNDQLLESVRALPLAEGYSRSVTVFAGAPTPINVTIKVAGREKIDVPAGTYSAYKVSLNFGSGTHYAWYDVNKPYPMIRYENTTAGETYVLTKVGTP
jgi:hypothetical protein